MLGQSISAIEISIATSQGFWLLLDDEEIYLSFALFPWFKKATIEQMMAVERPSINHLYWPLLDIDLSVESIRHPEKFPLIAH